ncbi:MAG: hypothetical protein ACXVHJ_11710 [Solirubrobacteraceae bacterium]
MTVQVWGAALAIVAGAIAVGYAFSLLGFRSGPAAPAVGLSLLIVISGIAIKLPGKAVTAAIVVLLALIASAVVILRHSNRIGLPVGPAIAGAIAALGAAFPFIANGRVGLPGVSLDNDTAQHLIYAEALRSPVTRSIYGLPSGYPLGPHSLADAVSTGLGIRLDLAFTGLLISVVILTAVVAAGALRGEAVWKQAVVGVVAALVYLVAAYYAEGAFKEPLMGLLLLAAVLHLERVRDQWPARSVSRWRLLVPVSLLIACGLYVYSYPALAWFGLTTVLWLAAEVVIRPGLARRWRIHLRGLIAPVTIAAALLLVLLAPVISQIFSFASALGVSPAASGAITTTNVGNLAHALSPYEALGIWNSTDFRFFPANVFHAGELSALALGILVVGVLWSVVRRGFLFPAAVVACGFVYWRSSAGQSIYVTAKALVIAGPVIAVAGLRPLLRSPVPRVGWPLRVSMLAAAGVFVVFAAHSSYLVLRNEPVWPPESTDELVSMDRLTRGGEVLFLGDTDYAPWLFHDSKMSSIAVNTRSLAQAAINPTKPRAYGQALDFDSVDPASLDRFRWVVTTTTTYASQAPANFRLVRRLRMYELWERTGPTAPRDTFDTPGAPGAVLNCHTTNGRQLSRRHGVAAIEPTPVVTAVPALLPGQEEQVKLPLRRGTWDLSLQYISALPIDINAGPVPWQMPAYLDRPGPFFPVGSVTSDGSPVTLTIRAPKASSLTGVGLPAQMTEVAATRSPDTRVQVPLSRACGRYVDWFRLS